ncbi:class I SAM-dependent methyltransferase [Streptomyces noursei]
MIMRTAIAATEWDVHYAAGRDFRPVSSEEEAAFIRNVGPGNGLPALDIGCGTGGFAKYLRECGYTVLGVDYAKEAISTARERYQKYAELTFRKWDAESDEWGDIPTCKVISSRLSYAFIQRKAEFLNNVKKCLSAGGIFYVMTPHADQLPVERQSIGATAEEIEELCHGWTSVKVHKVDSQHFCYTLTR